MLQIIEAILKNPGDNTQVSAATFLPFTSSTAQNTTLVLNFISKVVIIFIFIKRKKLNLAIRQVSLIYANVSPDDILLKKKLDSLAASHPNLKVINTFVN